MINRDTIQLTAIAAAALLLTACATPGTTGTSTASAPAAQAAQPPASAASGAPGQPGGPSPMTARPPADPTAPKPFAEVSRDAKRDDGLFPILRKDEKVWLEIPRAMLNKPFLFTINISSSIGERGFYASQMGPDVLAEWRRIGNTIQLVALNTEFRAEGGGKRAAEEAFSPSLLAAGPVASADHPERKAFLVDAAMLLSDIPGMSTRLEMAYRLPYNVDRANSHFELTRADEQLTTLNAKVHYFTPRIPAPPLVAPPVPVPTPPQALPDPRSMFMGFVYNFRALPAEQMAARRADGRLGHFTQTFTDLSDDLKANPRVHYINRWRLEKKDPAAELSEPVQPIVYWMDKNIPPKYRPAVEAGILEWNKAFEKIGFKNAVVAKQQPDDADWDNMDASHASIRWFVGSDVGFAIGPSHVDPRSGEILDADIGMSDVFARGGRAFISEDAPRGMNGQMVSSLAEEAQALAALNKGWREGRNATYCTYAHDAASEMDFALDILEARGEIAPDSPEADAFIQARIKDVIMHEVGHTLGLKHNFKASTQVSQAQLKDKAWTDTHGISASVMDYNAYNIPLEGEAPTTYNNTTLGAYDYWAIEYAYKQVPREQEGAELGRIAARNTQPGLAYADDTDAGGFGPFDGMDPTINRFDLGDDPLAYFRKRLKLTQELWTRVQSRPALSSDDPLRQRRQLAAGFNQLARASDLVGKYVGGMYTHRDVPGSAVAAMRPVDPAKQREALRFLAQGIFSADSFRFKPEFMTSITTDYVEFMRAGFVNIPAAVARVQLGSLDRLLQAQTAIRLMELPNYVPASQRKGLISINEVYGTLQASIWSELKTGAEIDPLRRNLQREYLRRLQANLTKGGAASGQFADAYAMLRLHAVQLQGDLRAAQGKGSPETRAHLAESLDMLSSVLKATMTRT
ncbi:zinc-dependent metalloprotease [Mitsuaria sp. GD03876]|uniref:zinc-dependent metalloprotease n=1 Tax=Mitsuaria sp. GD03876 TaxID=2975399 RepID=UPI002446F3C9|nr:zinc-dependent metalloprotease [Mitsuaria sp. GD03876]MDH0867178.1 zinc-dependent metalloprotease [Mitsuaria sp. GD03876]